MTDESRLSEPVERLLGSRALFVVWVLWFGIWAPGLPADQREGGEFVPIRSEAGLLYGELTGQPLSEVLGALERQDVIAVRHARDVPDHAVFAEFDGVPLAEALKEILAPANYALMARDQGLPARLILMGSPLPANASVLEHDPSAPWPVVPPNSDIHSDADSTSISGVSTPGEPEQPEESRLTGPVPTGPTPDLPEFLPEQGAVMPIDPHAGSRRELPVFEPKPIYDMPGAH